MASKAKIGKTTRDYLNEIISLYKNICKLKKDDYLSFWGLKERYLEFNERLELYKILVCGLEKNEIDFLNRREIEDFSKEHKELEGLVRYHLFFILAGLSAGKIGREYYMKAIALSELEFARTSTLLK
jgi:hypothetical protein